MRMEYMARLGELRNGAAVVASLGMENTYWVIYNVYCTSPVLPWLDID